MPGEGAASGALPSTVMTSLAISRPSGEGYFFPRAECRKRERSFGVRLQIEGNAPVPAAGVPFNGVGTHIQEVLAVLDVQFHRSSGLGPNRQESDRAVSHAHAVVFRLGTPPAVNGPPVAIAAQIAVRQVENIVNTAPDGAAQASGLFPHEIRHPLQGAAPILLNKGVSCQLHTVVTLEVGVFPEPDGACFPAPGVGIVFRGVVVIGQVRLVARLVRSRTVVVMKSDRPAFFMALHDVHDLFPEVGPRGFVGHGPEDDAGVVAVRGQMIQIPLKKKGKERRIDVTFGSPEVAERTNPAES